MIICFLNSLNGAGPIRTISQVQLWFGVGPIDCQNQHGGMASQCQAPYANRMLLIGLFTTYALGMHVKIRNDAKLTHRYIQDAFSVLGQALAVFAASYLPHAEWMIHRVFGEPRSLQNQVIVVVGVFLMIVRGIREYRLAFRDPMDSGRETVTRAPLSMHEYGGSLTPT
jgi:hypothetical protein